MLLFVPVSNNRNFIKDDRKKVAWFGPKTLKSLLHEVDIYDSYRLVR